MAIDNRNRRVLSLLHPSDRDLTYLLDLSRDLTRARYSGMDARTVPTVIRISK